MGEVFGEQREFMEATSRFLRRLSVLTGHAVAWLTLPMVIGTFAVALLRYQFDLGWIWMQESITWLHATVFMLASAYTLDRDEHVRVDIFYRQMRPSRRAIVDLIGTALFLMPMAVFLIVASWDYVAVSWAIREGSREAGGLPFPFVPLLKTVIPLSSALVLLQGVAHLLSALQVLRAGDASAVSDSPGAGV